MTFSFSISSNSDYTLKFSDENDPSLFSTSTTGKRDVFKSSEPNTSNYVSEVKSPPHVISSTSTTTADPSTKQKKYSTSAVERADLSYRRRGTVSDLFAALEEDNIMILRQISAGVKQFDRSVIRDPE